MCVVSVRERKSGKREKDSLWWSKAYWRWSKSSSLSLRLLMRWRGSWNRDRRVWNGPRTWVVTEPLWRVRKFVIVRTHIHTHLYICTPVHSCVHIHTILLQYVLAAFEAQANTLIFRSTKQERVDQIIFNTLPSNVSVLTSKPPVVCV